MLYWLFAFKRANTWYSPLYMGHGGRIQEGSINPYRGVVSGVPLAGCALGLQRDRDRERERHHWENKRGGGAGV